MLDFSIEVARFWFENLYTEAESTGWCFMATVQALIKCAAVTKWTKSEISWKYRLQQKIETSSLIESVLVIIIITIIIIIIPDTCLSMFLTNYLFIIYRQKLKKRDTIYFYHCCADVDATLHKRCALGSIARFVDLQYLWKYAHCDKRMDPATVFPYSTAPCPCTIGQVYLIYFDWCLFFPSNLGSPFEVNEYALMGDHPESVCLSPKTSLQETEFGHQGMCI